MKRKILAILLVGMMTFSLTACGGSSDSATDAADNSAATVQEDTVADDAGIDASDVEAPVEEVAEETQDATEESGDFTLLDVTSDLVDAALYSVDDDNIEYVITLFRDPDGNNYISLMMVPQEGAGDVLCGAYTDTNVTSVTDDDNIDWTEISTTDVYTGSEFTAIFAEADDGSVAIANSDFSLIMEGKYLTNDEAIAYMGAAANYIQ